MNLKKLLWYLAGSAAVLGCWALARAITQLWTGAEHGAQALLPVLASPLLSLPLGIFGAFFGHIAEKTARRPLDAATRFVLGGAPAALLIVIEFAVRAFG